MRNKPNYNTVQHPSSALLIILSLFILTCFAHSVIAKVIVVSDGIPQAAIVTSENPTETARYAVKELVKHVKCATGMELKVVTESRVPTDLHSLIYVGETKTAFGNGIDAQNLPRETFVMRSVG